MSHEASPVLPAWLSEMELGVLEFERGGWDLPLAKEQAIRETFGISGPQYYQILNALIDRREALEADPLLVKRLRRMRAQRRELRYAKSHRAYT